MDFTPLFDLLSEEGVVTLSGLAIGLAFGAFAQRSRFCMRAAVIEFFRHGPGPKTAIWLLAFAAAIIGTQSAIETGLLDVSNVRQLTGQGSLSGAIIGGLMFGSGMVLARGCASRILVLSATGNLRALVTGLILTVVAQASLRGLLLPVRMWVANLWTISEETGRSLSVVLHFSEITPLLIGISLFLAATILALHYKVGKWVMAGTVGLGLMITVGWVVTYDIAQQSFTPIAVKSISFIGPSADTLMGLINHPILPMVFDLGLVPGVFVGSFLGSVIGRDFKFQCFSIEQNPMPRYIVGAVFMGFGGMLAGECAVGAVMTGGSIFSLTAWVAMVAMWAGGGITDFLTDRRRDEERTQEALAANPYSAR